MAISSQVHYRVLSLRLRIVGIKIPQTIARGLSIGQWLISGFRIRVLCFMMLIRRLSISFWFLSPKAPLSCDLGYLIILLLQTSESVHCLRHGLFISDNLIIIKLLEHLKIPSCLRLGFIAKYFSFELFIWLNPLLVRLCWLLMYDNIVLTWHLFQDRIKVVLFLLREKHFIIQRCGRVPFTDVYETVWRSGQSLLRVQIIVTRGQRVLKMLRIWDGSRSRMFPLSGLIIGVGLSLWQMWADGALLV